VVVEHGLVEAGGVSDVVDADAVEAAFGEELGGGGEDGDSGVGGDGGGRPAV
jgi:hypothetical protein